jgi:hypothetical protein
MLVAIASMVDLHRLISVDRWPRVLVVHWFRSAAVLQQCKQRKQNNPHSQCLPRIADPVALHHG